MPQAVPLRRRESYPESLVQLPKASRVQTDHLLFNRHVNVEQVHTPTNATRPFSCPCSHHLSWPLRSHSAYPHLKCKSVHLRPGLEYSQALISASPYRGVPWRLLSGNHPFRVCRSLRSSPPVWSPSFRKSWHPFGILPLPGVPTPPAKYRPCSSTNLKMPAPVLNSSSQLPGACLLAVHRRLPERRLFQPDSLLAQTIAMPYNDPDAGTRILSGLGSWKTREKKRVQDKRPGPGWTCTPDRRGTDYTAILQHHRPACCPPGFTAPVEAVQRRAGPHGPHETSLYNPPTMVHACRTRTCNAIFAAVP